MYTSFFGLSDIPFSIAPNPEYLFLSDRHKEALAHLTYGLGDTGGFVLLTGEVGTGKTTISRRLLEQLPEHTQVAFILNPTLSCVELLATICDELKIRYKKTGITLKYLTDKIQGKLLANQAENVDTILMIDEAQHLQPEVLEQLRLLTNLETNTKKLLQVILIGQPELQHLLQRRDLRQLAQRITARYHLLPLTRSEVSQYISHRLSVADCHRTLFKPSAVKLIHKISKGIPRLINLLCDRALSTAFSDNHSVVTKKTVIIASQQALGSEFQLIPWWQSKRFIFPSLASSIVLLGVGGYWLGSQFGAPLAESTVSAKPSVANVNSTNNDKALIANTQTLPVKTLSEQPLAAQQNGLQLPVKTSQVQTELAQQQVAINSSQAPEQVISAQEFTTNSEHLTTAPQNLQTGPKQPESTLPVTEQEIAFDVSAIEGVSDDLLAKVQSAIEDQQTEPQISQPEQEQPRVPSLLDMPAHIQNSVPEMQFEVHIFSSDGNGWVRVNGRERYEGDTIAGDVVLSRILQNSVIMSLDGQEFSLPALSSW